MEIKEFTFRLMLLGVPGIACYFLLKKLIGKIGADMAESVLSIFVLSILCYLSADLFFWLSHFVPLLPWYAIDVKFDLVRGLFGDIARMGDVAILVSTLFSVPVAGLVGWVYKKKYWNRVCQGLGITQRYGDEDVFNFLLGAGPVPARWYVVRDHKEALVYYGAITGWSDEGPDRELILSEVDVYSNQGQGNAAHLYSCDTLYLCRKRDDISIELV